MKYKRIIRGLMTVLFSCIVVLLVPSFIVRAADEIPDVKFNTETGEFTFTTIDTKATSEIRWKTIGFTVRRDESNGFPRKDKDYAVFKLENGQQHSVPYGEDKLRVTFTFDKDQVNKAFSKTKLDEIKENDTIWFNGIFHTVYGDKENTFEYFNLSGKPYGIATAETWNNPNDFNDRFDLQVEFSYGSKNKEPITIERRIYSNGTSTLHDTKNYATQMKNTTFTTNSSKIPDHIAGTKYYLYRLYYVNLRDPKKNVGNRKTDINPYLSVSDYATAISYLRDREYTVKDKGLKIVAMYRKFSEKLPSETEDNMSREVEMIDPTAVIAADARGDESFDVLEGIPGTESLYANVKTNKYLSAYNFIKKSGTKVYPVNVTKNYTLTWTEKDEKGKEYDRSSTVPITKTYYIERKYSYWYIDALAVYGLDKATVINDALPGGTLTMNPTGYTAPTVSYTNSTEEAEHLVTPLRDGEVKEIKLPGETINGGSAEPSIPTEDWKEKAEAAIAKIKCKNDKLIFNGQTIMADTEKEEQTANPIAIPEGQEEIGENVFYKSGLVIPGTLANEEYSSEGKVDYKPIVTIGNETVFEIEEQYEISDINPVVVHTPVVCDGMVQDNRKDNQMITPDPVYASLVLDRPFYVTLPTTGSHRDIKGYGYRDYSKYIASRQVKFAFDVYKGGSTAGIYIPKNTWTSVAEDTLFYVPIWVPEGRYEIRYRSTAINVAANDGLEKVEDLANIRLDNYVAEDNSIVQISGRIYGLNIYDVTDYPIWEKVFRLPNSLKMTGFKYTVGTKDQNGNSNGQDAKYTLTMVNGSHPEYKNQGILKTGYMTRFSLTTVGSMAENDDYVRIRPKFYFVDKNGNNRQEVDIYYSETFGGKQNVMVKMGGNIDLQNDKSIKTGDPYLGIPESELEKTAFFEGVTIQKLKAQQKKVYNFMNIMLPSSLRMYVGTLAQIPSGVTAKQVATSVQKWYGEYYLPAEVHIVPKGFDVTAYAVNNGGLNYKESFWLKDGYIIVNFDITTVKEGILNLSYINEKNSTNGYCNMWKREGYQYQKTSYGDITFQFQDGDYIIYYSNKNVNGDWTSRGTH
ncbi:DUF5704 domain-containing protein [Anaerocolumna sp. AGMB13020]|uniref:DUF5704 domain-containing protein n=1 Tax=Anaerocolumna sp. AGMB13020 TaxID=3081750 RepID=UPI002955AA83|nr:DUF5704 domain-containing protein [Anaerocolumna sp. AGMB13020]WOO35096.1 DUF5704 domain-containing protein [Anaerocolumna sp. AGMB13020]